MATPAQSARGQSFNTVASTTYELTYDVTEFTVTSGGEAYIYIGTTIGGNEVLSHAILSAGSKSTTFVATTAISYLSGIFIRQDYDNDIVELDNISVLADITTTIKPGGLAQLISGMADSKEVMRQFVKTLTYIRDPYKTSQLSDLEKEFGAPTDTSLSDTDRRNKLAAIKYGRPGRATIDNMQDGIDTLDIPSANIVIDGDCEKSGTADWTGGGAATLSKEDNAYEGNRCFRITQTAGTPYAFQTIFDVGVKYRCTGVARGDLVANPRIGTFPTYFWTGTTSTDWQIVSFDFVADHTGFVLYSNGGGVGNFCEFDVLRVEKYIGENITVYDNDPIQDPAKVPGSSLLLDGSMEDIGTTHYSAGSSATLSKSVVLPKVGAQNLRIARNGVNDPYAYQDILTGDIEYRVNGWARGDATAAPQVQFGSTVLWTGTTSIIYQFFNFTATATAGDTFRMYAITSTTTHHADFDNVNVSIEPILLVNGHIFNMYTDWIGGCGEPIAECGEADMQCGENNGIVKDPREYEYDQVAAKWPLYFFIGGEARFYNLLLDGDCEFSGTAAAWSSVNGATLSKEEEPFIGLQCLRIAYNATPDPGTSQTVLTIGETYRVKGVARSDGTYLPDVSGSSLIWTGTISTDWQAFNETFIADATTVIFGSNAAASGYVEFDNMSVAPISELPISSTQCGEALAQCGEPEAVCGSYNGEIVSIDTVDIDAVRKADFERLILQKKPMHAWCVLYANYIG